MRCLRVVLLLALLSLNACFARGVDVEKIAQGQALEIAESISVDEFVRLRMQNRPRKALVGNWFILYQNQDFIYIGSPRFRGLSDLREVEEIYRVSHPELVRRFPGYESIEGFHVRLAIQEALQLQAQENESVSVSWGWQTRLGDGKLIFLTPARFERRQAEPPGQSAQETRYFQLAFSADRLRHLKTLELTAQEYENLTAQ